MRSGAATKEALVLVEKNMDALQQALHDKLVAAADAAGEGDAGSAAVVSGE